MKFCGFNGFGQFGDNHELCVEHLTELKIKTEQNKSAPALIAASWNYLACAWGNELLLQGFLSDKPNSRLILETPTKIACIAPCDKFCLVLTLEDGKLYKVLPKLDAQLEEIKLNIDVNVDEQSNSNLSRKRTAFGIIKPVDFKITHIACGTNMAVAVSNTNIVYSIPSRVHQFDGKFRVSQLVCGFEHALLLNSNGDVYCWGNGLRGQMGHDVIRSEESPVLLEALAGVKINFIAAGGWHSAAISAFGDLYTWGFNSNGQMGLRVFKNDNSGLKNPSVFALPQIIELPLECCAECVDANGISLCSAAKVFAGARHTMVLMSCGTLYAMGWNEHGQLGLSGDKKKDQIDVLEKVATEVIDVICGSWCTIVKNATTV